MSQSVNIYPNLIALSTLVEKKDAKVGVDINLFSFNRAWKEIHLHGRMEG
jgi:hypothetical protein